MKGKIVGIVSQSKEEVSFHFPPNYKNLERFKEEFEEHINKLIEDKK